MKTFVCLVLFALIVLVGTGYSAPPPPYRPNAWTTNVSATPVTGNGNLSVNDLISGKTWEFFGVGPGAVARLTDVAGGAVAQADLTACSNILVALSYTIGSNGTNYANSRAVALSNLSYAVGTASTNRENLFSVALSNLSYSIGSNGTNYANATTNGIMPANGTGMLTNNGSGVKGWMSIPGGGGGGDLYFSKLSDSQFSTNGSVVLIKPEAKLTNIVHYGGVLFTNDTSFSMVLDPDINNSSEIVFNQRGLATPLFRIYANSDGDRLRFYNSGNLMMELAGNVIIPTNLYVKGAIFTNAPVILEPSTNRPLFLSPQRAVTNGWVDMPMLEATVTSASNSIANLSGKGTNIFLTNAVLNNASTTNLTNYGAMTSDTTNGPTQVVRGDWATNIAVSIADGKQIGSAPLTNVARVQSYALDLTVPTRFAVLGDSRSLDSTPRWAFWFTNRFMTNGNLILATNASISAYSLSNLLFNVYTNYVQKWKPAGGTNGIIVVQGDVNGVVDLGLPLSRDTWRLFMTALKADGWMVVATTTEWAGTLKRGQVGDMTTLNSIVRSEWYRYDWLWDRSVLLGNALMFLTNSTDRIHSSTNLASQEANSLWSILNTPKQTPSSQLLAPYEGNLYSDGLVITNSDGETFGNLIASLRISANLPLMLFHDIDDATLGAIGMQKGAMDFWVSSTDANFADASERVATLTKTNLSLLGAPGILFSNGTTLYMATGGIKVSNGTLQVGEATFSGPATSTSDSASNSPAANEFPNAQWVRNLFSTGTEYYASTNISVIGTNASDPLGIYTFQSDLCTNSGVRSYTNGSGGNFLVASGYVGSMMTTNTFSSFGGNVTVNSYLGFVGAIGTIALTIKPEMYYSYDRTNWYGDYSGSYQSITHGQTNLYTWAVTFPNYSSTNAAGFYIQRRFKVGTISGTGTPILHALMGTNMIGGWTMASHIHMQSPTATAGNAYLANHQTFTGSNHFSTQITAEQTNGPLQLVRGDWATNVARSLIPTIVTNSIWVPAGTMSPGYSGTADGGWVPATAAVYTNGILLQDQYLFGQETNSGVEFNHTIPNFAGKLWPVIYWSSTNTWDTATNNTVWEVAVTALNLHSHLTNSLAFTSTNVFHLLSSNSLEKAAMPALTVTGYDPSSLLTFRVSRLGTNTWDHTNLAGATRLIGCLLYFNHTNWIGGTP